MTVIDLAFCRHLSRRAADSARRRQNLNLVALQVQITTWLEGKG
ncbi:MAG: hypothetical protein ACYDAI_01405 [Trichloromonadaceae bacterium]